MTATDRDIARLRRMIAEPTEATYDDDALRDTIERYPSTDERGVDPYTYDTSTSPPTQVAVASWYPTYDLHAAAADIWEEKASAVAEDYDYPSAEAVNGVNGVSRNSQVYDHYSRQARRHRAQRRAGTVTLIASPSPNRDGTNDYLFDRGE